MSSIQFGGVISGLNTQSIVDALVAAEKKPLTDLQTKEATLSSQKTAYAQLGSTMDDLIAKIKEELHLPKKTKVGTDPHYRCFHCQWGNVDDDLDEE